MKNLLEQFISWLYIRKLWGTRCPDIDPECIVCKRWIEHDEIFNSDKLDKIKDVLK